MSVKEASTLVVSTVSVAVLALVSSISLYGYSWYARPEVLGPGKYEKEIFGRIGNITKAVTGLKNSYKRHPFFSAPSQVKTSLEIERDQITSPFVEYFRGLKEKLDALAASNPQVVDGDGDIDEKDKKIEEIHFLPHSTTLQRELTVDPVIVEPTDKVIIKQVGLSLGTAKTQASVHRIQNLFGSPGLVGHLFLAEGKTNDWDKSSLLKVENFDFSTKDKFESSLRSRTGPSVSNLIFLNQKNQYIYVNSPSMSINDEYIKYAVEPEEVELNKVMVDFINPYKWLYFATKNGVVQSSSPIAVLVFPYNSEDGTIIEVSKTIKYPKDVNLFPLRSISDWDVNICEADETRILNHSKAMLTVTDVEFFDKLNE